MDARTIVAANYATAANLAAVSTSASNIEAKLPSKAYLMGSADADGGFDTAAKADVNTEVDTGIADAALATAANLAIVDDNVDATLIDSSETIPAALALIDTGVDNIEAKLPSKTYLAGSDDADGGWDTDTVNQAASANWDAENASYQQQGSMGLRVNETYSDLAAASTNVNAILVAAGTDIPAAMVIIDTGVNNIEAKLPSKPYLAGSADADGGFDTEAKADVNTEVDTGIADAALATAANLAIVNDYVDGIESAIGTPVALDGGAATLGGMLTMFADDTGDGSAFDATNDSFVGLRGWGDVNWGAGAGTYLLSTDVATGDTTTSFTMTAGVTENDAYNNGILLVQDAGDSHWEARRIDDYTSGRVITVDTAFSFTPAASDAVRIANSLAMSGSGTTPAAVWAYGSKVVTTVNGFAAGAIDAAAIADGAIDNATFADDVGSTAYGSNTIALATSKALDDYDPPTQTELAAVEAKIDDVASNVGDVLIDTGITLQDLIAIVIAYLDTEIAAILTATETDIPAALVVIDDFIDTEIGDIKTATDQLNFTGDDVKATLDGETTVLGSTGLNNISIADPGGVADTWPKRQDQMWRFFFEKTTRDATTIKTWDDSGNTVRTTQSWSTVDNVQTIGAAQ